MPQSSLYIYIYVESSKGSLAQRNNSAASREKHYLEGMNKILLSITVG